VKVGFFFFTGLVPFVGRRRDSGDTSVDPLFLSDIRLDDLVDRRWNRLGCSRPDEFFSLASNGVDCRIVVLCYQSELSVLSRILWDGDYGG